MGIGGNNGRALLPPGEGGPKGRMRDPRATTTYSAGNKEWDFENGRLENSNPKSQNLKFHEPPIDYRSNLRFCDFEFEFSNRPFSKSQTLPRPRRPILVALLFLLLL